MLKDKFRNKRAAAVKRRRSETPESSEPKTAGRPSKRRKVVGLPHYQPPVVEGSVSTQRKINRLQDTDDKQEIDSLMRDTFPARRHAIIEVGATAREIMEDYPCLVAPGEVRSFTI